MVVEEKVQQRLDAHALAQRQIPASSFEEVLTVEQTAALLDVTRQTVHNRVRAGQLRAYKQDADQHGGRTYFMKSEVLAALHLRTRPDGHRKHARRQFSPIKARA